MAKKSDINCIYETLSNPYLIITGLIIFIFVIYIVRTIVKRHEQKGRDNKNDSKDSIIENYRDPIYMNRYKLMYDYYPRSNGSIYGLPIRYGGNWHMFSGYPQYDTVY